ncbi:PQQ-binding-like beta-propeller repeat protein [Bacillus sp. FJAT-28004]|uniref:outer membrane protein assembly factor BamB family protein n=1 Tax=Bacillus sp. FJAT-28004 TaxID=1679165 RepID=UPI0006B62B09|nr:PQQ-binding-like beta-propeller repeat protein [Bacillus sp. FJAT-28004]
MNNWKTAFSRGVMLACCSLLLMSTVVSASIDSRTSYVGDNKEKAIAAPMIKPQWSLTYEGVVATGEGKAFYLLKGKVIAVNIQNGKKLWEYGSQLKVPLVYKKGQVYVNSSTGRVHAIMASSGKKVWVASVNANNIHDIALDGDQLFTFNGDIQAYSIKDGKFQWRDNYKEPLHTKILFHGDFIIGENEFSGAYTYSLLHAFNRKTGKSVWEAAHYNFPVDAKDGTITAQKLANLFESAPLTTLDTLDIKTGKVLNSVQYNPQKIDLNKGQSGNEGDAWISGESVYVNLNSEVYSYPQHADPSKIEPKVYKPVVYDPGYEYAAGPYDDKLIYTNGRGIYGVKLINKTTVDYNAGVTGLIARFDLIGKGIYVAQTDGTLTAIDLVTAKPILQLKTNGREFGETLLENGMIVVLTEGKLLAFKQPAGLKSSVK